MTLRPIFIALLSLCFFQQVVFAADEGDKVSVNNLLDKGKVCEYLSFKWQSKAVWWDFKEPIEIKPGSKLHIRYSLKGGDVLGVQLVRAGQDENQEGFMRVKTEAGGVDQTLDILLSDQMSIRRISFQIGMNAYGVPLNSSLNTSIEVQSVELSKDTSDKTSQENGKLIESQDVPVRTYYQ